MCSVAMGAQMQEGIISKECDLGDLILSGDGKYIGLARTVRMHRI
jgi:hypothetical protein